jgi:hypothetical protein
MSVNNMNMEKQQDQKKEEEQTQQWNPRHDNNAYSLFLYGLRSPVTRDYYLRRLRIFFNYIRFLPGETMEKRCNFFAIEAKEDPNWVFNYIIKFLQFQRERVERKEIVS